MPTKVWKKAVVLTSEVTPAERVVVRSVFCLRPQNSTAPAKLEAPAFPSGSAAEGRRAVGMRSVAAARSLRGEKFSVGRFFVLLSFFFLFSFSLVMQGWQGMKQALQSGKPRHGRCPSSRAARSPAYTRGRPPLSEGTRGEGAAAPHGGGK